MLRFAVPVGAVLPLILLMTGSGMAGPTLVEGGPYPDLRAANPHHFTVQNNQQREFLRFSNMVANTGAGDLILRPEHDTVANVTTGYQEIENAAGAIIDDQAVSEFVFHPAHNHWHLTAVALFEIRKAPTTGAAAAGATSRRPVGQDDLLPDRRHQARRPVQDARTALLGLLPRRAPGHLGRLGRPVPPRDRGPGARGDRARRPASTTS